jgi:nitrate reductase delta subunit
LPGINPQAASLIEESRAFAEGATQARLEELYTSTFDLKAVCHPYVGYHLFGESYKRGAFLARLNEGYRERGFSAGSELPDHLPVVLRFLALKEDGEFSETLLREGVIPAVEEMAHTFRDGGGNPYKGVIQALALVLRDEEQKEE